MTDQLAKKIVAFRLANEEFGIPMDKVISIERMKSVTNVPQTSAYIRGILELRGEVIPIVDLRKYLFNGNVFDKDSNRIIVIKVEQSLIGFIVDEATDIIQSSDGTIEKVPITGMKVKGAMNVVKLNERLIILIDVDSIISNTDIAEALKELNKSI